MDATYIHTLSPAEWAILARMGCHAPRTLAGDLRRRAAEEQADRAEPPWRRVAREAAAADSRWARCRNRRREKDERRGGKRAGAGRKRKA